MKQNLRLIIFILILGMFTSGLIVGMDVLTSDRIQENQLAQLKAAVLSANEVSFTPANIHQIFETEIDVIEVKNFTFTGAGDYPPIAARDYFFYQHKQTKNVSYEFTGSGLWGAINGVITLKEDMQTIVNIVVLQQQETPGLGGIVAEPRYLARFVNIIMVPKIEINKDTAPNKPNEVDTITGATGTSKAFENILNQNYAWHMMAWLSREE